MDKLNCRSELSGMLENELEQTEILTDLLIKEKSTISGDNESLLKISTEKKKILDALENYNSRRNAFMQAHGFSPTRDGIESCISWCDKNNTLANKWILLKTNISQCKKLNLLNGSIVDNSLRSIKQALSILYGQQENLNTYSSDGHENKNTLGRSIAKA